MPRRRAAALTADIFGDRVLGRSEAYTRALRTHVLPTMGRLRAADVTEDDVARLIALLRRKGYSEWTIHGDIVALSRVLGYAVRRGMAAATLCVAWSGASVPPAGGMRILDSGEIGRLIAAAGPRHQALIATAPAARALEPEHDPNVYSHLFDSARHADRLAAALENGVGDLLAQASST